MTEYKNKRTLILVLLFITVVVNYMDRVNISVAMTEVKGEFGISTEQVGFLFSAFFLPYMMLQIPGGLIADFVKARILYPILLIAWSLATVAQGFANSFFGLLGARAAIGVFEAPTYPTNDIIVTSWFPREKRASAISVYTSGQFLGIAFLAPILAIIQNTYGWRGLMIITGLAGIAWAVVFYLAFPRNPPPPESLGNAPIENKPHSSEQKQTFKKSDWSVAFVHRKLWGLYLGQFCLGTMTIFFLTWFPTYLTDYKGITGLKSGYLASIPFMAAFVGVLLSGHASDFMVKKNISEAFARKAPVLIGMMLSTIIIAANFTDNLTLIIIFLSIAFFGNGLASIAWVFVSLLAPTGRVGLVGGVFNMCGAFSALVTPVIIGFIVTDDNFAPALFYIGAAAVIGILSYIFLVGSVDQIQIEESVDVT